MLSRQKKIPKLDKLLARGGKKDVRTYLDGLKAGLPAITMEEWRRRMAPPEEAAIEE